MATCYNRKRAWLPPDGGQLIFNSRRVSAGAKMVTVPCGHCLACRVNHASNLATRVMHEMEYAGGIGCFVTLTYRPEDVPFDYAINKRDVQTWLKRLRRHIEYHRLGHLRAYLACGEYGDKRGRPHYHALLLGWQPSDLVYHGKSYSGEPIYTSAIMERIWSHGFCPVGTCTIKSASYVARYAKKAVGVSQVSSRVKPFLLYSRNIPISTPNGDAQGSLGAQWCIDHMDDLRTGYLRDHENTDIAKRIPDYYFDLVERYNPELYAKIKEKRLDYAMESTDGWYHIGSENGPCACPEIMIESDALNAEMESRTKILRERARVQDARLSTLMRRYHK